MNHHDNIWYVFRAHPHDTELHTDHELLGKFWLNNGQHSVLEDHGAGIDGLDPTQFARQVKSLHNSSRRLVASSEDIRQGRHPGLFTHPSQPAGSALHEGINTQITGTEGPKISEYRYHREGMPAPQHLKLHGHQAFLDDHPLSPDEISHVMDNVQTGKATLRHHVPDESMTKAEPALREVLATLTQAAQAGQVHPDAVKDATKDLFKDTMVPDIGNLAGYRDFANKSEGWLQVYLDLLGFWKIRKELGHHAADQAIIAFNRAIAKAASEAVGMKDSKVFRYGGAETRVFIKNMEETQMFVRAVRTKLEAIPSLRGVFNFAAAIGAGRFSSDAQAAVHHATQRAVVQPWGKQETQVIIFEGAGSDITL